MGTRAKGNFKNSYLPNKNQMNEIYRAIIIIIIIIIIKKE
jgi:hypothetical protein